MTHTAELKSLQHVFRHPLQYCGLTEYDHYTEVQQNEKQKYFLLQFFFFFFFLGGGGGGGGGGKVLDLQVHWHIVLKHRVQEYGEHY